MNILEYMQKLYKCGFVTTFYNEPPIYTDSVCNWTINLDYSYTGNCKRFVASKNESINELFKRTFEFAKEHPETFVNEYNYDEPVKREFDSFDYETINFDESLLKEFEVFYRDKKLFIKIIKNRNWNLYVYTENTTRRKYLEFGGQESKTWYDAYVYFINDVKRYIEKNKKTFDLEPNPFFK